VSRDEQRRAPAGKSLAERAAHVAADRLKLASADPLAVRQIRHQQSTWCRRLDLEGRADRELDVPLDTRAKRRLASELDEVRPDVGGEDRRRRSRELCRPRLVGDAAPERAVEARQVLLIFLLIS
jgi:hypothetical protein